MSDNRTVCEIYQEYQDECKHCLRAEVATLRHDLLNEQAASRMAHEVAARNRALEAENAQLRHALANAEVAAGFAKEMAEKVKTLELERDTFKTQFHRQDDMVEKLTRKWKETEANNGFDAKRLRRLATVCGVSVPESDEALLSSAGTVLGAITRSVERILNSQP